MLEIGTKVRDKEFPNLKGVIDDIDRNYEEKIGIYYSVTFNDSLPFSYLWYQEKDLEIIDD